jgi:hypothetical protein
MPEPRLATVKRLFAVSGNICAFPQCTNPLVDSTSGKVTGRICHIKARKPGFARYDPNQSEDERHAFDNLILMCPIHHDVIDSDTETYTVERLQEIKTKHEADNAGGYEPSDDIARQLLVNIESNIAVLLNADASGKIDWSGDILHSSTKIVIDQAAVPETQEANRAGYIEGLIRDIQSTLYDEHSRLPYVLTLCLDLCDRVGLSEKYGKWIRAELSGYGGDYKEFQSQFDDEEQFECWMQEWASHRLITPYIKGANYIRGRIQPQILELPVQQMLIGLPVARVVRDVESAKMTGSQEFSIPLLSLGQERFVELQSFIEEVAPGSVLPSDLRVFYKVTALERVLDGVRSTALSLLSDARSQIAT